MHSLLGFYIILIIMVTTNIINWVFFDLDDTLWDFALNSEFSLELLYNKNTFLAEFYPDYNNFSTIYHRENDRLWALFNKKLISADFLKPERFRILLAPFISDTSSLDHFAHQLCNEYLNILGSQTAVVFQAENVLNYLSKKYMIGVLSNGFREVQYKKLYNTSLWKYVQRMVISDEINVPKPDTRIFEYALQATGAKADSAIMIGDNPLTDIKGAIDAGWNAIYFNKRNESLPSAITNVPTILSLSELKQLL